MLVPHLEELVSWSLGRVPEAIREKGANTAIPGAVPVVLARLTFQLANPWNKKRRACFNSHLHYKSLVDHRGKACLVLVCHCVVCVCVSACAIVGAMVVSACVFWMFCVLCVCVLRGVHGVRRVCCGVCAVTVCLASTRRVRRVCACAQGVSCVWCVVCEVRCGVSVWEHRHKSRLDQKVNMLQTRRIPKHLT